MIMPTSPFSAASPAPQDSLAPQAGSLLVFSDDWGRHPSSCQHMVRHLLNHHQVTWVNTIGTRAPRLDLATMRRVTEKLRQWCRRRGASPKADVDSLRNLPDGGSQPAESAVPAETPGLSVVNPKMWPWFCSPRDRYLNRWLLNHQLSPLIRSMPQPVTALTTLPITADLAGVLPVSRWVYYCVDDFSQWPGLDGKTLRMMDVDMIRRADSLVAVSETLQAMIAAEGRTASLLTHGVDVEFWRPAGERRENRVNANLGPEFGALHDPETQNPEIEDPKIVFWGVVDRRMDSESLIRLSQDLRQGTILLIGPQQDPDPRILALPNVRCLPPQPMEVLPEIARKASVLIMPYADLPVTRAMQPLKLKEYMATGKPVVVNRLPSTTPWNDCLDNCDSATMFSQTVCERIRTGVSPKQLQARQRLQHESWAARAVQLSTSLWGTHLSSAAQLSPRTDRLSACRTSSPTTPSKASQRAENAS